MKRIYIPKKEHKPRPSWPFILLGFFAFAFGCIVTVSIVLHVKIMSSDTGSGGSSNGNSGNGNGGGGNDAGSYSSVMQQHLSNNFQQQPAQNSAEAGVQGAATSTRRDQAVAAEDGSTGTIRRRRGDGTTVANILENVRILVAIAAFDFAQIPHLEEVLDAYHDVCLAGPVQVVDVVIHATIAYPVTLIDLWNSRFNCEHFSVTVILKPKSLRLHLVDCHRTLFYERIDQYDLFIYTEDDIRIRPTTIATYLYETQQVEKLLLMDTTNQQTNRHTPSDFNVGIVRYEYNYPANVIIDDNTRHATQNVTRVYWEHSNYDRVANGGNIVPNAIMLLDKEKAIPEALRQRYVTMKNHHQGMFLATRELLLAWKDRGANCNFDQIRDRPGRGSQPSEGTQRVWMSSQMLYGARHCNVQQVLPRTSFGALTVLHLPNKNYRRVGKYRNRTFSDGTEVFQQPHASMLLAMDLHLAVQAAIPATPQRPYRGIRMLDEVTNSRDRSPLLERRMKEYVAYVERGGVLSPDDMTKTNLVEDA
jgi:hypothetical protein